MYAETQSGCGGVSIMVGDTGRTFQMKKLFAGVLWVQGGTITETAPGTVFVNTTATHFANPHGQGEANPSPNQVQAFFVYTPPAAGITVTGSGDKGIEHPNLLGHSDAYYVSGLFTSPLKGVIAGYVISALCMHTVADLYANSATIQGPASSSVLGQSLLMLDSADDTFNLSLGMNGLSSSQIATASIVDGTPQVPGAVLVTLPTPFTDTSGGAALIDLGGKFPPAYFADLSAGNTFIKIVDSTGNSYTGRLAALTIPTGGSGGGSGSTSNAPLSPWAYWVLGAGLWAIAAARSRVRQR